MSKEELLKRISEIITNDDNIVYCTLTWWNEDGTFNWDSESDKVT